MNSLNISTTCVRTCSRWLVARYYKWLGESTKGPESKVSHSDFLTYFYSLVDLCLRATWVLRQALKLRLGLYSFTYLRDKMYLVPWPSCRGYYNIIEHVEYRIKSHYTVSAYKVSELRWRRDFRQWCNKFNFNCIIFKLLVFLFF